MKTRILLFSLLLAGQMGYAQSLTQTQKLTSLCKVWGFLKYYHPEVSKGTWDWDSILLKKIPIVEATTTKEELSKVYTDWLSELGDISKYSIQPDVQTATPKNKYLQWLNDETIFTKVVSVALENVRKRRDTGNNFYVKAYKGTGNAMFQNEKAYSNVEYPGKDMRLLSLFRYWNMTEYFFPYKYVMDKDWELTLSELIPEFTAAQDIRAYGKALKKMAAGLNDSHANIRLPENFALYPYMPPFMIKLIDGKAIVTRIINDSLSKLNDIQIGDVITAVNDTPVATLMTLLKPYIGASNEAVILRNLSAYVLTGYTNNVNITYERNGVFSNKKMGRYIPEELKLKKPYIEDTTGHKMLTNKIAYVNLGTLKEMDNVKKVMSPFLKSDAIILDVRNYPNGTMYAICNILSRENKPFVTFTRPDFSSPGAFQFDYNLKCGIKNRKHYKGKIIVLLDEQTQSHAEFTCMSFKTLPNVTLIGSQTAGADGNVSFLTLPGGLKTQITGLGVYYPDHTETQRIGIVPDIEVKPTIKGIQEGRDEVLERAVAFINTGK